MDHLGDLLIITPSRGRPEGVRRLLTSVHETAKLATHVHVAVDRNDPELESYRTVMDEASIPGDTLEIGSPKGLTSWTNKIAKTAAKQYPYLASLGDDMVPKTKFWDYYLTRTIEDMGGTGFSYPWGIREDVPEAVILSSDIVRELGWMALPCCQHFFIDNAWADLGRGAGCLRHCRAIAVDHVHPRAGTAEFDKTHENSSLKLDADREAYFEWRRTRMSDDINKIIALREKSQVRLQVPGNCAWLKNKELCGD